MVLVGAMDDRFDLAPSSGCSRTRLPRSTGLGLRLHRAGSGRPFRFATSAWLARAAVHRCRLHGAHQYLQHVDRLDRLAGRCAMIAFAGFSAIALMHGAHTSAILAFSMLARLRRLPDVQPADEIQWRLRTFIGDAGGMLLGFMLACVALILIQPEPADIPPCSSCGRCRYRFSNCTTTGRRLLRGMSPMRAVHGHFRLPVRGAGFSVRLTFMLYVTFGGSAWFGVMALEAGVPGTGDVRPVRSVLRRLARFRALAPAVGTVLPLRLRRHLENLPH